MATDSRGLRTDSVRIKLSPEMLLRVEKIAEGFGMPTATLAAFAVASYVQQVEQGQNIARMAALAIVKEGVGVGVDNPELVASVAASMFTQLKAGLAGQSTLPLDVGAPGEGA